jgi:hypothetical protein
MENSQNLISRRAAENAEKNEVEIRVLSLLQPWASLLVFGEKMIETRSWKTSYRGPVAIHASLSEKYLTREIMDKDPLFDILYPPELVEVTHEMYEQNPNHYNEIYRASFEGRIDPYLRGPLVGWDFKWVFVLSALIGIGKLVDCVPTSQIKAELSDKEISLGDYSEGRWAWKFEGMRPIRPIGMKGALGLRRIVLPEEVVYGQ